MKFCHCHYRVTMLQIQNAIVYTRLGFIRKRHGVVDTVPTILRAVDRFPLRDMYGCDGPGKLNKNLWNVQRNYNYFAMKNWIIIKHHGLLVNNRSNHMISMQQFVFYMIIAWEKDSLKWVPNEEIVDAFPLPSLQWKTLLWRI